MIPPYKTRVLSKTYHMYLDNVSIQTISHHMRLTEYEVNEIIDYLNEIYT